VHVDDPRLFLSAVLRAATPRIIARVVLEAMHSSGAGPEDGRAYEALMRSLAPEVLDAVAANDADRARAFAALGTREIDGMRAVPPVARVGLLEIGLRLAREEVAAAARGRPDRERIERELAVLSDQMRSALLALGSRRDRREHGST
jgi:hypothetical protein